MSTVTELVPTGKLTCTAALAEAYRLALKKLPEQAHGRLAKARLLAEGGQVFETDGVPLFIEEITKAILDLHSALLA